MSHLKLVLFDCDGTLIDSSAIIHQCMEETFSNFGITTPTLEQTLSIIGLSLNEAIATLLGKSIDEETAAMVLRYKNNYNKLRLNKTFKEPIFPGVHNLLNTLGNRNDILLGIVTGKSRRGVLSVCKNHGLNHFSTVRTADDCPSKPHPAMVLECCAETGVDMQDCFVVGDAIYDMQMARAAGAIAIGVSWGYHAPVALRQAGAEFILQKPDELLNYIKG